MDETMPQDDAETSDSGGDSEENMSMSDTVDNLSEVQDVLDLEHMIDTNCDDVRGAPRCLAENGNDADCSATGDDCDDDGFFADFCDDDTENEAEVQAKAPPSPRAAADCREKLPAEGPSSASSLRMLAKENRAKDAEEKEEDMADDEGLEADVDEAVVRKRGVVRRRSSAAREHAELVKNQKVTATACQQEAEREKDLEEAAAASMEEDGKPVLRKRPATQRGVRPSELCPGGGTEETRCLFAQCAERMGQPARLQSETRCVFCDPPRLLATMKKPPQCRKHVTRALKQFLAQDREDIFDKALARIPEGYHAIVRVASARPNRTKTAVTARKAERAERVKHQKVTATAGECGTSDTHN
jgi:hypothetical protein